MSPNSYDKEHNHYLENSMYAYSVQMFKPSQQGLSLNLSIPHFAFFSLTVSQSGAKTHFNGNIINSNNFVAQEAEQFVTQSTSFFLVFFENTSY